jgi:hypothetical protein
MLRCITRAWRHRRLKHEVEEKLRAGVGLHRREWLLTASPISRATLSTLGEEIVAWCAETIAHTRRPYGIDHLAAAIACARPGAAPLASASFGVFRPADFYRDGGTRDSIYHFVQCLEPKALNAEGGQVRFAVALFSWGEVARAMFEKEA